MLSQVHSALDENPTDQPAADENSTDQPAAAENPDSKPAPEECPTGTPAETEETPCVLHVATLTRNDRLKVQRIVTPKPTTGNLAVPKDIYEMWQGGDAGKQKLLSMWCKSGGVKAGW